MTKPNLPQAPKPRRLPKLIIGMGLWSVAFMGMFVVMLFDPIAYDASHIEAIKNVGLGSTVVFVLTAFFYISVVYAGQMENASRK